MTTLIGEVSWGLHPRATYVQVSIPGRDGIPLALKVTHEGFDSYLFKKGRIVEVRESGAHGRFVITRVFDEVKESVHLQLNIRVKDAEDFGRRKSIDKTVEKNAEKVRFYLCSNYFNHPDLHDVLNQTMGITFQEFQRVKRDDRGMTFICTTDQFARFLIERNRNGIKNGFMDLSAKLIQSAEKPDAYETLAKEAGITHEQAKLVSTALGYTERVFQSRVRYAARKKGRTPVAPPSGLDVSSR